MNDENAQSVKAKKIITIVGLAMLFVGLILVAVFLTDFIVHLSNFKSGLPKLFWLSFISFPMAGIGGALLASAKTIDTSKPLPKGDVLWSEQGWFSAEAYFVSKKIDAEYFASKKNGRVVCIKCGKKSKRGAAFCTACGAEIKDGTR
jgi:hypothetical protein